MDFLDESTTTAVTGDEQLNQTEQATDYQTLYESAEAERKKTQEQYRSLQGQFDSVRNSREETNLLRAQIDDLRTLVAQKNEPQEVDSPLLSPELAGFLDDNAQHLESSLNRTATFVEKRVQKELSELKAQIAALQNEQSQAPLKTLRATDPVLSSAEYTDFLKGTKDNYGDSLYDRISLVWNAKGQEEGLKEMIRFKKQFLESKPESSRQLIATPSLNNFGANPASASKKMTDADANKLRQEYAQLAKNNLGENRARRIAIQKTLALNGFN